MWFSLFVLLALQVLPEHDYPINNRGPGNHSKRVHHYDESHQAFAVYERIDHSLQFEGNNENNSPELGTLTIPNVKIIVCAA